VPVFITQAMTVTDSAPAPEVPELSGAPKPASKQADEALFAPISLK